MKTSRISSSRKTLLAWVVLALLGSWAAAEPPILSDEPDVFLGYEIVYAAPAGDADELFSFNLSADGARQLTSLGGFVAFPVWSPSGDRILFLAGGEETSDLMVMEVETGDVSVLVAGSGDPADWGPNGERILITRELDDADRGLFIVDVASGAAERVDTGSSSDAYARWSRTGDAIVYESGRDGNPEIYRTDLEMGETVRLTHNQDLDEWPSPSPDGDHIAWASGNEEEKDLWVMRADGTQKRRVTEGILFGDAAAAWSPDGRQILMTAREGDSFVLKLVDLESGAVTHLREGAGASWR